MKLSDCTPYLTADLLHIIEAWDQAQPIDPDETPREVVARMEPYVWALQDRRRESTITRVLARQGPSRRPRG